MADPARDDHDPRDQDDKSPNLGNLSPADTDADRDRALALDLITGMQATIEALRRDNWRLVAGKAERDALPQVWRPLKAAAIDAGVPYQDALSWCNHGVIVAEKRGGRWFVRVDSLRAHVAALRGK
jgi:hypothetical protein